MNSVVEKAYAKINLYLDIESRREDGYHNIISIMHSISLCDNVKITTTNNDEISILCNIDYIPCDRRNLAYRAAEFFLNALGKRVGIEIELEKHIPAAAGLGGGSSDAAAVLRGLNRIFEFPFSFDELCKIGANIGADIPFCVIGGCAEVRGIGELLDQKQLMPDCYIVLSCAGEGISTPVAYGKLDEKYNNFKNRAIGDDHKVINCALENSDINQMCSHMYNIFEEVILSTHFEANDIKCRMIDQGALKAMMSGSGPSVFGIFDDEKKASLAFNNLVQAGYAAYICQPKY